MTLKEQLDAMIPAEAVETRESWGGGPKLSYLTGAYVINRLNQTLGQGNWAYEISSLTKVHEGTIAQSKGDVFSTSYIATVSLTARIEGTLVKFTDVGYGDGTDKKSPGKAHELATKEAVTDAIKRAAKNLGLSLGLGLYFKSGEYVDEAVSTTSNISVRSSTKDTSVSSSTKKDGSSVDTVTERNNSKVIREQIKTAFGVLQAQKKVTKEDFVKVYLAGKKADELTDTEAIDTITLIKMQFPELGL